jgi:RNA polymerase sigma-70 factor (ECF subfamily)
MQMCGSAPAAEDVTQETFLALFRQMHAYDETRGAVVSYLFGIARHHVIRRLGGVDKPLDHGDDATEGFSASHPANPFDRLVRAETVDRVRAAVQSLPIPYREAVVLCELHEMDYASAAAVLECPIGTVRSRLHRARALLIEKLSAAAEPRARAASGGTR